MSDMRTFEVTGTIPQIVRNEEHLYEGNLVDYFAKFVKHAPNTYHPYHNVGHSCNVMYLCHEAIRFYRSELGSPRETRNLLVAALFHDYDHTGTAGPDSVNIARAIAGMREYMREDDIPEIDNIAALMSATEYPHHAYKQELTLPMKVLRDADVMQVFSPTWIQQVVFGLAKEQGIRPQEMLNRQLDFLASLTFTTDWAKRRIPQHLINEKRVETEELCWLFNWVRFK